MSSSNKQILLTPEQSNYKLKRKDSFNPDLHKHESYWCAVVKRLDGTEQLLADFDHNVFPAGCVDSIHNISFINTSNNGTRGFVAIAVTADKTQTLNSAVTALTGEITTNGLARAEAVTKTHTAGTNVSLVEHTFTLSGSQSDVTRAALFNVITAPVSGTIGPVAAFSTSTGPMVSGETLKVSITITTS